MIDAGIRFHGTASRMLGHTNRVMGFAILDCRKIHSRKM